MVFVRGLGLQEGAMGSSVNVFNQAIVVVAATDEDLAAAASAISRKGSFVATRGGQVVADFPIPLLGLSSDLPFENAKLRVDSLLDAQAVPGVRPGVTVREPRVHHDGDDPEQQRPISARRRDERPARFRFSGRALPLLDVRTAGRVVD